MQAARFNMQVALFTVLGCLSVPVVVGALVSPSILHHGPILQQVTIPVGNYSEVYHVYSVTYTTTRSKEFCVMSASASAYGFRLNVLGEARQSNFERDRYLDKLWALKDFMAGVLYTTAADMRARTLILFLDAYDVLVNGTPQTLVRRFVKAKKKILFSAGKGCCSTKEALQFRGNACDAKWPVEEHTTTPFLNSGVYIGFVAEIDQLLRAAKNEYDSSIEKIEREYGPIQPLTDTSATSKGPWDPYLIGGEQQLFCDLFAHHFVSDQETFRNAIGISIDYHSQIFVSLYKMEIGREIKIAKGGRALYKAHLLGCDDWTTARSQTKCRQRSKLHRVTRPVILHFNGPQKNNFTAFASKVRWPNDAELWESDFFSEAASARVLLKEACALHSGELACGNNVGHCLAQSAL